MIALAELAELNQTDLRLDRIKKQLAEIDAQLGDPPWLATLDAELAAQQALVDTAAGRRTDAEAELAARRAKMEAEDARLYDGSITDARELRNQQEAVYALRRALKDAQDPALALMEAEEAQGAALAHLQALRSGALEAWRGHQAALRDKRAALAAEADRLQAEVDGVRGDLPPDDLAVYDQQRRKRPVAIAAVIGGVCGACRLALPTTVLTRARRGVEPVYCPTCSCIVFVP